MTLTRLSSGYWLARWSDQIWAQWSVGNELTEEAFFVRSTATQERITECYTALADMEEK